MYSIFAQIPAGSAEYGRLRSVNKQMYFIGYYANQSHHLTKLVQYIESVLGENRYFAPLKERIQLLSKSDNVNQIAQEDRAILWRIGELFVSEWISKPTVEVYHHIGILFVKDFDFVYKAFTQILDIKATRRQSAQFKLLIPLNVLPLLPSHCEEVAQKIKHKSKELQSLYPIELCFAHLYIARGGTTFFNLWEK